MRAKFQVKNVDCRKAKRFTWTSRLRIKMKTPKLICALFAAAIIAAGLAGCKTPQLETGGAYHPTEATAPDTALYVTDAAYKFAYGTVGDVFRFERDNRQAIAQLAPQVKPALDKLRPVAVEIDSRWARARRAYSANPTPSGLDTIKRIVAEVERLLPVVQAELRPYYESLTGKSPTPPLPSVP